MLKSGSHCLSRNHFVSRRSQETKKDKMKRKIIAYFSTFEFFFFLSVSVSLFTSAGRSNLHCAINEFKLIQQKLHAISHCTYPSKTGAAFFLPFSVCFSRHDNRIQNLIELPVRLIWSMRS